MLLGCDPSDAPQAETTASNEGSKIETYRKLEPMMAMPAIYFFTGEGIVLGMLHGEVTSAQISDAIENGKTP